MPKTKISEFSATPANNTDIDSINIAEGCAPSGINDAIRELMAQLKDFQTGAVGDSFNGPIGTTTAAAGAFTTLSSTGNTTLGDASGDAITVNGTATFANVNPTLTAGTANGVTYLNGSKVLTSGSALTFDGTNLGFGSTGQRITGDFTNATIANRVAFQTSTANSITSLSVIPNGTGTQGVIDLYNNSDPTNASNLQLIGGLTQTSIRSSITGTGTYVPITMHTGGSEKIRIDTSGNVGIGTSSPSYKLDAQSGSSPTIRIRNSAVADGNISKLLFEGSNNFSGTSASFIQSIALSGGNSNTALVFGTNAAGGGAAAEVGRFDQSGNLLVGKTASDVSVAGTQIESTGTVGIVRNAAVCLIVNRLTDDGTLVSLRQASTEEGTISVSGTTVSYNGGHLSRWAQMLTTPELFKGTVMSNLDEMNVYTKDGQPVANEQLNKVKVSDTEGDVNVAGVFVNWSHDEDHNVDEINMAMTGDMIIRIAQGVTVVRGDLLMSAGDGTAKPQGDDIVRSKTVAKVTSNHITCTYADGSYCVPCVLMAC